jgi:hypothetical protein
MLRPSDWRLLRSETAGKTSQYILNRDRLGWMPGEMLLAARMEVHLHRDFEDDWFALESCGARTSQAAAI